MHFATDTLPLLHLHMSASRSAERCMQTVLRIISGVAYHHETGLAAPHFAGARNLAHSRGCHRYMQVLPTGWQLASVDAGPHLPASHLLVEDMALAAGTLGADRCTTKRPATLSLAARTHDHLPCRLLKLSHAASPPPTHS